MSQRPKSVEGFEELLFTTKFGTPINTQFYSAAIKPKTVQQYLGHATLQMTMDFYTHVLK